MALKKVKEVLKTGQSKNGEQSQVSQVPRQERDTYLKLPLNL